MVTQMSLSRLLSAIAIATLPAAASAEMELSFYGGAQSAPHTNVTVSGDSVLPDLEFTAGWDGRSLAMPPYYGVRATWWRTDTWGWGFDINHAKVYADDETLAETGYDHLEFSDGLNILTVNAYRRWPGRWNDFTPYVGAGLGIAVPHFELIDEGTETWGYQYTGPAIALMAGTSYDINDTWSVFAEYKFTFSMNTAKLDTGGTFETNIPTNALNIGVAYKF